MVYDIHHIFVHTVVSPDRAILTQLMSSETAVVMDQVHNLTLKTRSCHNRDEVVSKNILGRLQKCAEIARIRMVRTRLSQQVYIHHRNTIELTMTSKMNE